jgi:hypothetical protein
MQQRRRIPTAVTPTTPPKKLTSFWPIVSEEDHPLIQCLIAFPNC